MASTQEFDLTLGIETYRAFRDRATFRLRPLTLLYGRNQAGKSTLLRLLPFLGDSLQPGSGGLDMESPALRGASFKELGWLGPEPAITPRLIVEAPLQVGGRGCLELQWSMGTGGQPELNEVKVGRDGGLVFAARMMKPTWAGLEPTHAWTGQLVSNSLIPEGFPTPTSEIVKELAAALDRLGRVQWLQAWSTTNAARPRRMSAPDGSDLAGVLAKEPEIVSRTSQWLEKPDVLGQSLRLAPEPSGHRSFLIGSPGAESLRLELAGEGVRALLPIALHAVWAESSSPRAASMLAIEEPEAHLHPKLQVALFDRLVQTVKAGVPVVIETHSVYLLRAMQRAVLNGLPSSQVGLYWVDRKDGAASLRAIEVSEDAALGGWPPAVLDEEQQLAREVLEARWRRGATE